jgi:hypothetical protein
MPSGRVSSVEIAGSVARMASMACAVIEIVTMQGMWESRRLLAITISAVIRNGKRGMDVILTLWSTLGLPATVLAFACALVRGAKFLENGASEEALRYISGLLRKGPLTAFGPLGAAVVPLIFKALLGSSPLSLKFIARSIILSLAFWLVLILIKHPVWNSILDSLIGYYQAIYVIPVVLLIDWISLAKASVVLQFMSLTKKRGWTLTFVVIDILLTCILVISVYPIIYFF